MVLDSKYVVILYQPTLHISPAPMYLYVHCLFRLLFLSIIMRPSSLGGAAYCVALSVRLSVCLSVRPVIERHVAPPSELQWHTNGRISYGHLGRTNLFQLHIICYPALGPQGCY